MKDRQGKRRTEEDCKGLGMEEEERKIDQEGNIGKGRGGEENRGREEKSIRYNSNIII